MKKLFLVGLVLILIVVLTGCGDHTTSANQTTPTSPAEPNSFIRLIVNNQTYDYNVGYNVAPFDGACFGSLATREHLMTIEGFASTPSDSTDNLLIFFTCNSAATGSYPVTLKWNLGDSYMTSAMDSSDQPLTNVTITQFDVVGGRVIGTFSGTLTGNTAVTGSFNVKRYADNALIQT